MAEHSTQLGDFLDVVLISPRRFLRRYFQHVAIHDLAHCRHLGRSGDDFSPFSHRLSKVPAKMNPATNKRRKVIGPMIEVNALWKVKA